MRTLKLLDLIEFAMQYKLDFEEFKSLVYSSDEFLIRNDNTYNMAVTLSRLYYYGVSFTTF